MRITREGGLQLLLDAARRRAAEAPSQDSMLMMLGLNELAGRELDSGRAALLHGELSALLARLRDTVPDAAAACADAIEPFAPPPPADTDPARYFLDALRLLQHLVAAVPDGPARHEMLAEMAAWEERVIRMPAAAPPSSEAVSEPVAFSGDVLGDLLRAEIAPGADVAVESFHIITGGMSKRAFLATTDVSGRGREEMVLKMAGGSKILAVDCMTIPREFGVLKAAWAAGLMVPEPLWEGRVGDGEDGDLYAMRRSEGGCTTDFLTVTSPIPRDVLLGIAEQLARLHSTTLETIRPFVEQFDPEQFQLTASGAVRKRLREWEAIWQSAPRLPSVMEDYLVGWLHRNLPENDASPALIHGDCSPHNCLWEGDRLTAVIDWECAHFGDPAEDIAYIRPTIEQRMDWAEWLAHYEACGGPKIAPRTIEYFACYDHFRNVVLTNFYLVDLSGADLRPLAVDAQYAGMFAATCMDAIRRYEAMG